MQIMIKRMSALLLAAVLLAALGFGGTMAWAADSGQDENSLTVHPVDPKTDDPEMVKDVGNAHVQVDVYKIAKAKMNESGVYDYTLESEFASLQDRLDAAMDPKTASSWQEFSNDAANIVFSGKGNSPVLSNWPVDKKYTGLSDGMYLVIPHGKGITPKSVDGTIAKSEKYEYKFLIATVAIPNKTDLDGDGKILNAESDGDWIHDVEIILKREYKPIPPENVSVTVNKVWSDANNKDKIRPNSVEVKLYVGSTLVEDADPLTLNANNNWKGEWEDLPKCDKNGKTIQYTVKETKTSVITGVDGKGTYKFNVKKNSDYSFTVTNTHTPKGGNNPPRTGDDRNLLPFYIIMAVSGVALVVIAATSIRRRRRHE